MKEPLVSILIPAYNAQDWISATIESALQQSWPNKEIIVVDDGSKDQTFAIVQQFAPRGVKAVTQGNQGAAATRNKAFDLSHGDYIQWLDADDLLSKDKVASQMRLALDCSDKRVLLSCAWGYFMHRAGKAKFVPSPLWQDLTPVEWLLRKWEHNAHMQTATWLVSRELTQAAGPWNMKLLGDDDGEYFFRVVLACNGIRFSPDAKVFYRRSGVSSLSRIGSSNKKRDAQFLGMQLQIEKLRSVDDSPRARAAMLKYLQIWLHHFYPERPDLVERAQCLASLLGGKLDTPRLRWKFAWLQPILGYGLAKRAQFVLRDARWSVARAWDKAMFSLETKFQRVS